jgi:predicted nucleotidyltransferase
VPNQIVQQLENVPNLTLNEREAILEFSKRLREKFGPSIKEIILFGSKVKGRSEKDSDIDILIVLDSLSWEIKRGISELAAEENIKHNVVITTIRYDIETWENPVIKVSPFAMSVKNEGIWL